ncbi:MAG: hypothetical protein ACTSYI_03615 [Promethearchaeota archaeon]
MGQSSIATTAGIMSLFATFVAFLILIPVFQRYLTRKKKNTLFLAGSIMSWLATFIFATNIYFFSEANLDWVILCQKLVYVGVFLGTMFTFQFSQEIFFNLQKKWIFLYWGLGLVVIFLTLVLDSVEIAVFPDGSNYPLLTISLAFSIMVVIYILPTLFGIFYYALQTAKKIDDKSYRMGFKIIALSQIMIFATFIADTLASLMTTMVNLYALLLYLTWIFPLIAVVCYYLGWIMPNWFRKRYNLDA